MAQAAAIEIADPDTVAPTESEPTKPAEEKAEKKATKSKAKKSDPADAEA